MSALGHSRTNVIPDHCCATMSSALAFVRSCMSSEVIVAQQWDTLHATMTLNPNVDQQRVLRMGTPAALLR